MLLNSRDMEQAETLGFSHVEEDTRWATFWFDEEDIERAVEDYDEQMGDCISIVIEGNAYMVKDTKDLRTFLNEKFSFVDE